uniref:Uncharacterized protein n=1 Tax=Desertifilum tharense IPPAS B-1220 TaxID=1781255 RepID=A0ACD5H0S0_9CYAN
MKKSTLLPILASFAAICTLGDVKTASAQISVQIQTGSFECPSSSLNIHVGYSTDDIRKLIARGCRIPRSFYPPNYHHTNGCTVLVPGGTLVASGCTVIPQESVYAYPTFPNYGYPSYPVYSDPYSGGIVVPPSRSQQNRVNGIGGFLH